MSTRRARSIRTSSATTSLRMAKASAPDDARSSHCASSIATSTSPSTARSVASVARSTARSSAGCSSASRSSSAVSSARSCGRASSERRRRGVDRLRRRVPCTRASTRFRGDARDHPRPTLACALDRLAPNRRLADPCLSLDEENQRSGGLEPGVDRSEFVVSAHDLHGLRVNPSGAGYKVMSPRVPATDAATPQRYLGAHRVAVDSSNPASSTDSEDEQ